MLYSREILPKIKKVIFREEFIILTGARQTGKTSVLFLLKKYLEEKKEECFYINLENPEHLKLCDEHPFNVFELLPEAKKRIFVFIDEIQYLRDPSNFLKLLYDQKRAKVKIIASGSSSFFLDQKFRDSLAGRKFLFEIYPLNFSEFLIFNDANELAGREHGKISVYYRKKIAALWEKYILFGGYPKVALADSDDMRKIILEELGSAYVKKDVQDAGIRSGDKYFSLIRILAGQAGRLVNSRELAATLAVAHKTIDEYLYVMKKSYQAAFIRPFFKNTRKELVKMPKVYFYDTGLLNFFLNDFSPLKNRANEGSFLENIVFRELRNSTGKEIKFWRTQDGKEVDFIVNGRAYEVKYSADRIKEKKYAAFREKYPDIKFRFISEKDIPGEFYGFRIDN